MKFIIFSSFSNEKQIVEKAYQEYLEMRSQGLMGQKNKQGCVLRSPV